MKNMKTFIKIVSSLLAVCVCLPLLLSCKREEEAAPTPTPVQSEVPVSSPQPITGGELVIPMPRNPFITQTSTGANPLRVNTEEMRNLYLLVYEPLIRCDAANRITPSLAEKWACDDTGRVWTITLRENVLWHDGDAMFGADDVIYTLSKIRELGSDGYYYAAVEHVDSMEKVDERTLRVTMKSAGASKLYALVFPVMRANDTSGELNGTGPYKVKSASGTVVELTANMQWWRQAPYIQSIRCLARDSNDVALDSYEAGLLNFVPTTNVSAGKYRESGITQVLDVMTQDAEMLLLNSSSSVLSDLNVRKAIAYAIDRGEIVSNVYMNRAEICDVPVPPDSYLYDPTTKIYDYNLAQANSLLEEAGWRQTDEEGVRMKGARRLELRLMVNDSTESTYRKSVASILQTQLLKAGILLEIETAKLSIGEDDGEMEQRLRAGDFDIAMLGFNVDRSGDLMPYLSSGGKRNYGGYTSESLGALMRAASIATEEKDIREKHAALQHAIVEELPFITLYFRKSSIVYSEEIQGMVDMRGSDIMRTVHRWYMRTAEQTPG